MDNSAEKADPPPRYVVWDSTPEKLGDRSDKSLLVKRRLDRQHGEVWQFIARR